MPMKIRIIPNIFPENPFVLISPHNTGSALNTTSVVAKRHFVEKRFFIYKCLISLPANEPVGKPHSEASIRPPLHFFEKFSPTLASFL
jgi:hypothetical protein